MFARWAKTAKAFTKIGKEIVIAVKMSGADPAGNPRLRMAIQTARGLNMPKDRIEAAIKRAAGKEEADLLEINYPGYAPHGIALLVAAATDNPTRTAANVRSIFSAHGGSMAAAGSLDYAFAHRGMFKIKPPLNADLDSLELELIDFGLIEFERDTEELTILTEFSSFGQMQQKIESLGLELISAGFVWLPANTTELTEEQEAEVRELIDALEEDEDVQHVFMNMA